MSRVTAVGQNADFKDGGFSFFAHTRIEAALCYMAGFFELTGERYQESGVSPVPKNRDRFRPFCRTLVRWRRRQLFPTLRGSRVLEGLGDNGNTDSQS